MKKEKSKNLALILTIIIAVLIGILIFTSGCTTDTAPSYETDQTAESINETTSALPTGEAVYEGKAECTVDADCDDMNECTVDYCDQGICFNDDTVLEGDECNSGTGRCSSGICEDYGACCYPDDSCAEEYYFECTFTFLGGGSTCDPNPCGEPTGQCVGTPHKNSCVVYDEGQCNSIPECQWHPEEVFCQNQESIWPCELIIELLGPLSPEEVEYKCNETPSCFWDEYDGCIGEPHPNSCNIYTDYQCSIFEAVFAVCYWGPDIEPPFGYCSGAPVSCDILTGWGEEKCGETDGCEWLEFEYYDFGDAPDSTNSHYPIPPPPMYAYQGVYATFPTAYLGSSQRGPCHNNSFAVLGTEISGEEEADNGTDQDNINNIWPPTDTPDKDSVILSFGMDDGLKHEGIDLQNNKLQLNHCAPSSMDIEFTIIGGADEPWTAYLNVWIDYNQDGNWGTPFQADTVTCTPPTGGQETVSEWVIQNRTVLIPPTGLNPPTQHLDIPFAPDSLGYIPTEEEANNNDTWVRVQLTKTEVFNEDGSMGSHDPNSYSGKVAPSQYNCYEDGETEDYLVEIVEEEESECFEATAENYIIDEEVPCVIFMEDNIDVYCTGEGRIIGDGTTTGVLFDDIIGSSLTNCLVENHETGILIDPSYNNSVIYNTVANNSMFGIYLQNSHNNTIQENNVYNNSECGICLEYSTYNEVVNNEVHNNPEEGIQLFDSDYNDLYENDVYENKWGIDIGDDSDDNYLEENDVYDNTLTGLRIIAQSNFNIIYNDTYSNNTNWDIRSWGSQNNYYEDVRVSSYPTRFTLNEYTDGLNIKGVDTPPNLEGFVHVEKFLNITSDGIINITIKYEEEEITYGDETDLGLYRYDGAGWELIEQQSIDYADDEITGILDEFSIFAPLIPFGTAITECGYIGAQCVYDEYDCSQYDIEPLCNSYSNYGCYWNETTCLTNQTYCEQFNHDETECLAHSPGCKIAEESYYYLTNNIFHPLNSPPDYDDTICFRIIADNIVFDCNEHKITGLSPDAVNAFQIKEKNNITIKNCVIDPEITAIHVQNSEDILIDNVDIECGEPLLECNPHNCGGCIGQPACEDSYVSDSCEWNSTLSQCQFKHPYFRSVFGGNTGIGIHFEDVVNSTIQYSTVKYCAEGMFIDPSVNIDMIENNVFFNDIGIKWLETTTTNDEILPGGMVVMSTPSIIAGNDASYNKMGFFLFSGTNNLYFLENQATYNDICGFCLEGAYNNNFLYNYAYWNRNGYQMQTADDNLFNYNLADTNVYGYKLTGSDENRIIEDTADNNCVAIYGLISEENLVDTVDITNSWWFDLVLEHTYNNRFLDQLTNSIVEYNFTDAYPIFEDRNEARLEFTDSVTQDGDNQNLNSDIQIINNTIYVNSQDRPGLNVSAHLSFYNLGFYSLATVAFNDVDFEDCSLYPGLCKNTEYHDSYYGGTLEFDVEHFTKYSTKGIPALSAELVNPMTATNVEQNQFFTFTTQVTCLNGDCGNVTAYIDPHQVNAQPANIFAITGLVLIALALVLAGYLVYTKMEGPWEHKLLLLCLLLAGFAFFFGLTGGITGFAVKDHISTTPGDLPFYTLDPNPMTPDDLTCLENMLENNTCNTTWQVNATGPVNTTYEFFVEYYAEDAFDDNTSIVEITIIEGPLVCTNATCSLLICQNITACNATAFCIWNGTVCSFPCANNSECSGDQICVDDGICEDEGAYACDEHMECYPSVEENYCDTNGYGNTSISSNLLTGNAVYEEKIAGPRVYFVPDYVEINEGDTVTLEVWVEDVSPDLLKTYQMKLPLSLAGGIAGSVDHGGLTSPVIDGNPSNSDYVFFSLVDLSATDNITQTFGATLFSTPYANVTDPKYLGEITYIASLSAKGEFIVDFINISTQSFLKDDYNIEIPATYDTAIINISQGFCYRIPPVCGNGIVESGEECDDGNTNSGDGCSSTCQNEGTGGGGGGSRGGSGGVSGTTTPVCSSKTCPDCDTRDVCESVGCVWDNMRCVESFEREYEPIITEPEIIEIPPTEEEPALIFEESILPLWFIALLIILILGAIAAFLHQRTAHGVIPAKKNIRQVRKRYPHHVKKLDEYIKKAKLAGKTRAQVEASLIKSGGWNKSFTNEYLTAYWKK